MKIFFNPIRLYNRLLGALFVGVIGLGLAYSSLILVETNEKKADAQTSITTDDRHHVEQKLFLAPADFSLTHQQGKHENLERICCSSLQNIKVIRSSIFDEARQEVLSQRLAMFTQSSYFHTLSPIWHPSIPIAHRKLVI